MLRFLALVAVVLSSSVASAQPKLTKELGEKVRTGAGSLTEQEVLKLVPGPVTVTRVAKGGLGGIDADLLLQWEEATKFEVLLVKGKVTSVTATFSDVAPSKALTLDALKRLKEGMSLAEVEKVLGRANSTAETIDDMDTKTTRCAWSRSREIRAYVKDGKVNGGGFIDTSDK